MNEDIVTSCVPVYDKGANPHKNKMLENTYARKCELKREEGVALFPGPPLASTKGESLAGNEAREGVCPKCIFRSLHNVKLHLHAALKPVSKRTTKELTLTKKRRLKIPMQEIGS